MIDFEIFWMTGKCQPKSKKLGCGVWETCHFNSGAVRKCSNSQKGLGHRPFPGFGFTISDSSNGGCVWTCERNQKMVKLVPLGKGTCKLGWSWMYAMIACVPGFIFGQLSNARIVQLSIKLVGDRCINHFRWQNMKSCLPLVVYMLHLMQRWNLGSPKSCGSPTCWCTAPRANCCSTVHFLECFGQLLVLSCPAVFLISQLQGSDLFMAHWRSVHSESAGSTASTGQFSVSWLVRSNFGGVTAFIFW